MGGGGAVDGGADRGDTQPCPSGCHPAPCQLCGEVTLELRDEAGGTREIGFRGECPDTFGAEWSAAVPPGHELSAILLDKGRYGGIECVPAPGATPEQSPSAEQAAALSAARAAVEGALVKLRTQDCKPGIAVAVKIVGNVLAHQVV